MTETIVLPSDKTAGAITGSDHGRSNIHEFVLQSGLENAHRANLHATHETTALIRDRVSETSKDNMAAIKEVQFETAKMVADVRQKVIEDGNATRALILEKFHQQELRLVSVSLQDAKDEIIALKIKAGASPAL